jgi:hypothetical protein
MAKKKIAKTLLVGLGGTGNLALKYAKKRFYEMYGEGKPFSEFELPLIEYLALDTSIDDLKFGVGLNNQFGLKQSEYHHLKVSKPRQVLNGAPFIEKEWMPKKNLKTLSAIEAGAGQIRAFGRLGLMNNYQKIKEIVQNKVGNLNSWKQDQNKDYEAMGGAVNIVFCFSVAGGTGSGTFLDMAYLLKDCLADTAVEFRSQAYIILPEIFDKVIKQPIGKKRIWSNSYGALRELEFFMEEKYNKNLELLDNNQMTIPVEGAPFDLVHLVSDKNSIGTDYDEIPHIMELVGSSVVFKSGGLNTKSKAAWDNIGKDVSMMDYLDDANTQKPRYLGLGYAEIQYNTKIVSDFLIANYAAKLSDFLIDSNNRESDVSLEQKVLTWGIKEDEADDLLDQLLPLNSFTPFVLDGDGYSGTESRSILESNAEAHLSNQIQNLKKKSAANLQELTSRVIPNIINDFVNSEGCILDKGGIKTAIDAIEKLLAEPFVKRYAFQMSDEIENNYSGSAKGVKHYIKTIEKRIQEELKGLSKAQDSIIFTRRGNCMPIIESLVSSYNKLLDYNSQKIKREDAKQFYAKLTTELEKLKNKLSNFKSKMAECKSDFHKQGQDIRKEVENETNKPFTKELHKIKIENSFSSAESSIRLSLFLDKINKQLSSFIDMSIDDVKKIMVGFIQETSVIQDVNNDNLSNYLATMPKQEVVEHLKEIKKMSQPLLQVVKDKFALNMGDDWTETALWGVGSIKQEVYGLIESDVESNPEIMDTQDHSFLMLSTLVYPAPIFALTNMQRYYDDYMSKRSSVSCDTDKRIREAMDDANFDLIPKDVAKQKTIFAWIFGIILHKLTDGNDGIYRRGTGKFFIKTKEASIADQYWFDLGTPWRTLAFETFTDKNLEGEMLQKIKKYLESIGSDKVQELIQEIKEDYSSAYINKYSELNRSWKDLKSSKDSRDLEVAELMEIEINFINTLSIESINDYL